MEISKEELDYLHDLFTERIHRRLGDIVQAAVAPIATAVASIKEILMSQVQDLHTEFIAYKDARDAIDVKKDAESAAKDATVADAVQKLADAAVKAGADAQTIADLQAGIDAAVQEEKDELAKLTPPEPPAPPVDDGSGSVGTIAGA